MRWSVSGSWGNGISGESFAASMSASSNKFDLKHEKMKDILRKSNNPKGRVPRACPWVNDQAAI